MKKITAIICMLAVLVSCNTVNLFASQAGGYTVSLDNNIYEQMDYLAATIHSPEEIDLAYSIEILKAGELLAVLQNDADQNSVKIRIPSTWPDGNDYTLRAGRGTIFTSVGFAVGKKTYALDKANNNGTVRRGETITFKGTSNAENGTINYTLFYNGTGSFQTRSGDLIIKDKSFALPVAVDSSFPIGSYRFKIGNAPGSSEEILFTVTEAAIPKVQVPRASLASGKVSSGTKVTLSTETAGAVIYYTTDGSAPTRSASIYNGTAITVNSSLTLKAFAVKENYTDSDILIHNYTVETPSSSGSDNSGGGGSTTKYTVTFETNGGNSISSQSITSNGTVTKPNDPAKKGFIFTGWYTDSKLTSTYDFSAKVTKSFTLYAGWEKEILQDITLDESAPLAPIKVEESPKYKDTEGHWAENIIDQITKMGIASGYPDGTFKPDTTISRAEFVKMTVDAFALKMAGQPKAFNDVKASDWYKNYIDIAVSNQLARGISDNMFGPNMNITRQDICVIMYNALIKRDIEIPVGASSSEEFADSAFIADYAKEAVYALRSAGIVNGRLNGLFDPATPATRAEAAAIIYGVMEQFDTQ